MKVRYNGKMPEDVDYLTSGKWYEVEDLDDDGNFASIIDDDGEKILTCMPSCAHLDDKPWELSE